ncbi:pro-resilin-like [Homarus americanus]|uniref:pro-resilin-like n=1 Tax=Homarus americanus TaxID=6706 RepID=UPI001C45E27D|nr:pro-resilin-like [Homarus americanus]
MISKVLVLAVLVASVIALPSSHPSYGAPSVPAQYDFTYAVKDSYSGNDFGHQENRNGYNTQGVYFVQLPDGRVQRVTYTVNGDEGFVAQVGYQGEAQYPAYHPSPSYNPGPSYGK